ncbi:IS3 family transposase [Thermodesulfovibrio thiophilus]|uniref:IS3 family transposase n=1 Tax=Thermodesulfovibrio thiophilus TaxID=340095 RepID=UPI0017A4DB7E|nr:IS3 family transposase [Thermodesulfovibrio thiophilus]HHW21068.1 transposase [Thermodesulfovibrio thiophilus]
MIEPENPLILVYRQCELIGLRRSSYYYEAIKEREYNLLHMKLIDEQYMRSPFYGSRKMTAYLIRAGHKVNRKRVQRLMRLIGIEGLYPKKRLRVKVSSDNRYSYLLKDMAITEPDQVWSADI